MKSNLIYLLFLSLFAGFAGNTPAYSKMNERSRFFAADNKHIQYTGRIDFSNPLLPRFYQSGVYIKAAFKGSSCSFIVKDEVLWGKTHNYIQVVVDDTVSYRIQTRQQTDTIDVIRNLSSGVHTILICKNTEAGNGYLEFGGFLCNDLVALQPKPVRKIECFGNSITCGMSSDLSVVPCGKGEWYDQHNAYLSYGAITARRFKAQWHLSAVSGIGLIHSCCDMKVTMPQVFDKINMRNGEGTWDFRKYQPDIVTICLGQNDGIQDSVKFCRAYVQFIQILRTKYPKANIVCLTSPMASAELAVWQKRYLTGVVNYVNKRGDLKVTKFYFSKQFRSGCGDHPDLNDHRQIAEELSAFIAKKFNW